MSLCRRYWNCIVIVCVVILLDIPSQQVFAEGDKTDTTTRERFRDDFRRAKPRPELEIMGEDKNRWAMVDNEYLLLVPHGPNEVNVVEYNGVLPKSYVATIKF